MEIEVTSKCHTLTDMNRITSFGYRGEGERGKFNDAYLSVFTLYSIL